MIRGHGGNIFALAAHLGCSPADILDFSSNINPLGMMPELQAFLKHQLEDIGRLPEVDAQTLVETFAACYRLDSREILAGSGTTEFIYAMPRVLGPGRYLILGPTYADYADACRLEGLLPHYLHARRENGFSPELGAIHAHVNEVTAAYICNPNNPTGTLISGDRLRELCGAHPGVHFVIDESYLPFVSDAEHHSLLRCDLHNVSVLHSLSKIFAIPGLRIGFIRSSRKIIELLRPRVLPWNVNSLAQSAAQFLLTNRKLTDDYLGRTRAFVETERAAMIERCSTSPLFECFASTTSFMLIHLRHGISAEKISTRMAQKRMLIRNCSNFEGLDDSYIRIALKSPWANLAAARALRDSISPTGERCHGFTP